MTETKDIMRETRHILSHRSGTLELVLEEESGAYTVRFHSPPCAVPDFLRALKIWIRAIGRGWQKRNGKNICNGDQTVTTNFSSQQTKGKFNETRQTNQT
jgi:hypothetical protein